MYNKLWERAGPLILNSRKYSNDKNELSREQQLSTIMLLENKGKSTVHLNKLRHYSTNK